MSAELLARAERAFAGRSAADVASDYRAIVGPSASDDARVRSGLEALRKGRVPTPLELAALELAIKVFRPSLLSRDGALGALGPAQAEAFPAFETFRATCGPRLRAVCRIDRGPHASPIVPQNVGTGFLVAERSVATNRHVLETLAQGGHALERGMAVVHFGQELGRADDVGDGPIHVVGVVGVHDDLDVAVLELAHAPPNRAVPTLGVRAVDAGRQVVVVGYPFEDEARNPLFVSAIFGNRFGVRRAAPGEVMRSRGAIFEHDCSTLGGSSGSPVFDMQTGEVLGVHFHGSFAGRNRAVSADALRGLVGGS